MTGEVIPYRPSGRDESTRPCPASLEIEQEFLGALLLQNSVFAQVAGFLRPDHFFDPLHQRIFSLCVASIGDGKGATPSLLAPFLGDAEVAVGLTARSYLARLVANACAPITAKDYGASIRDLAARRDIIIAAEDAIATAIDPPANMRPAEITAALLDRLAAATEDTHISTRESAAISANRVVERAAALLRGEAREDMGVSTGYTKIDEMAMYRPGDLWLLAGRPSMGKSVAAASSAVKVAGAGNGVLFFSAEISQDQFPARLLADLSFEPRRAPISFQAIMRGQLDETQFWQIQDAAKRLGRMPLTVDYSSRLTVIDIRARVHSEKKRLAALGQRLWVIFIDYLKFIVASDRYKGFRVHEVGEISAGLKQVAKDEGVCIVLLAQLNRANEARDDKRPTLADLRDSGSLEEDADVVMFVYREAYYLERSSEFRRNDLDARAKASEKRNDAELILAKNRAGPTGTPMMTVHMAAARMEDRRLDDIYRDHEDADYS